ncbi:MAG: RNA 2',3'-cyclic phosphodiesterase [Pirellulales bacterium]|nr:RNA 2',3'-cyclic phosphodiesterase [Pirellulales bacterium]
MASPLRTFVGLELSAATKAAVSRLIERLQSSNANVRWTAPENLHITLKFLGDVQMTSVAAICRAVTAAATPVAPFRVSLGGAGAFPDINRPRVLWLGVKGGSDSLIALHARVEQELAQLSFPFEARKFTPHITLGRVRGPSAELTPQLEKNADFPAEETLVNEVVVYSSELTSDGPHYSPLGRAKLVGE